MIAEKYVDHLNHRTVISIDVKDSELAEMPHGQYVWLNQILKSLDEFFSVKVVS